MKKYKLIVVNLLPFDEKLTGTGYFFIRLFRDVLKLDSLNHYELHLSQVISDFDELKTYNNVKLVYHKIPKSKLIRIIFEQFIFPFQIDPDIFFSPSVSIPIIFRSSKCNYITTIHDLTPFIFKKYSFLQQYYVKLITKLSAKFSDKIITVSENSKCDLHKIIGTPLSKIFIIYNSVDESIQVPYVKKEKFFMTVSTVQPGKNLLRLVQAFHIFSQIHPEYKLLIIGRLGWMYEEVFRSVKHFNLENNIEFLGYVSEFKLIEYYRKAKALLYVSLYEGFGIPPLEAMNCGCPVVVSNISSLPEVVGDVGIYVDPYSVNDIARGIEDSLILNLDRYYSSTRLQVRKFNSNREAQKFINIISME